MKRFAVFGALFALLIGALLLVNYRRQQTPAYLLRHYPPSANLDYVIEHHVHPASSVIFRSDWFDRDTTGSAAGCEIYQMQGGSSEVCQSYSENTVGNAGLGTLAPAQLARFQALLRALPPGETAAPPLNRLLVVSYGDGPNWTTRLYDRAHLPPQITAAAETGGFRGLESQPE